MAIRHRLYPIKPAYMYIRVASFPGPFPAFLCCMLKRSGRYCYSHVHARNCLISNTQASNYVSTTRQPLTSTFYMYMYTYM